MPKMNRISDEPKASGIPANGLLDGQLPPRRRRTAPAAAPATGWRRYWPWLLVLVVLLVAAGLRWREPLAGWLLPVPPQVRLLQQAEQALAAGELTATDGLGARELFTAVLALTPDNSQARAGLIRVGEAALAQADEALRDDRRERARHLLALARDTGIAPVRIDPLAEQLRRRDSIEDELERLLGRARQAEQAGRLDDGSGDSALALYQRMLEADPDNAVARAGRDGVLQKHLSAITQALENDDLATAGVLIGRVEAIESGNPGLPMARAGLTRALNALLEQADQTRQDGLLEAAEAVLARVLVVQPDHAQALAVRERLAQDWLDRAQGFIEQNQFDSAELALLHAGRLQPQAAQVDLTQAELARARQQAQAAPVDHSAQVAELVRRAEQARQAGRLLSPPADNAWDLLQRAAQLAPGSLEVGRARAAVARDARACLSQARAPGDLPRAGQCLQLLDTFDPADPSLPSLRRTLASRWLGMASERLGAGELAAARRALAAASGIDPEHPDLPALQQRIEQAQLPR